MRSEALAGARIAVTGASGFVGRHIVRALLDGGAIVQGFGRRAPDEYEPPATYQPPKLSYSTWDITRGPLERSPCTDAVVHCAGLVTDWGSRAEFWQCHVDGTRHVLASFTCPLVHISTASVYDPRSNKHKVAEAAAGPARYLNGYSESKAVAEKLVEAHAQHIVLRPHAIYGPGDRILLPRILSAYRFGRMLAVGDGQNELSVTHVDNLTDAVLLAVTALLTGRATGVFNIADDQPVRVDTLLRAVLQATGRTPRIAYMPRAVGYGLGTALEGLCRLLRTENAPLLTRYRVVLLADECTLDLTRAKTLLGYCPTRTIFEFIARGGLAGCRGGDMPPALRT